MTKIYFIRHCEGEGNAARRSQTLYDGLVTTKGMQQCEALRQRFHDIPLDAVYSSDAYRARVAADILAEDHGLKTRYRWLLREYNVGVWDGDANGNARRDFAKYTEYNDKNLHNTYFPGGDTYESIEWRAIAILKRLLEDHKDQTIAVVSHAYMLRILLCYAAGLPKERITEIDYGDNTAVSLVVEENGVTRIEFMADISHLPMELRRNFTYADREGIDMPTELLQLPQDRERLLEMDALMCRYRGREQAEPEQCVAAAMERISQNQDYVAFILQMGKTAGMLYMSENKSLSEDYAFLEDWYMDADLRRRERDLQMLGHAIHVARKENKRYLAVKKPTDEQDKIMLGRFFFEEIPGHADLLRLDVVPPACPRAVI